MKIQKLFALALALCVAVSAVAYETGAGGIQWKYHNGTAVGDTLSNRAYANGGGIPTGTMSGSAHYAPNFSTAAKPLTAPATLNQLAPKIGFTLQERRHIDKSSIVLSSDDQTNIKIAPGRTADVWVTFMSEGAGFENSVGYFTYELNTVPLRHSNGSNTLHSERILFPRASTPVPLPASSTQGTTVYLGQFEGGAHGLGIGFFIASNGWSSAGRGSSPQVPGVKAHQHNRWIFYSLRGLNPECSAGVVSSCLLNQHSILLHDGEVTGTDGVRYRRLVLGFEDFLRSEAGSDHDFNDVLLAVHATPSDVISNLASLPILTSAQVPDTDGDGINDAADEFPNDPKRALSRYYPGSSSWGTLAYEDSWPVLGDYDMNDVVVRYRAREVLNASRAVATLEMDLRLDARGGQLRSGFALSLPGVLPSQVESVVLTRNGETVAGPVLLTGVTGERGGAVFEIFSDATALMPPDDAPSCATTGYRNTGKDCPIQEGVLFKLVVNFKTALSTFPSAPYDPYIFNSNGTTVAKGVEIHLPGREPTTRADRSLIGTRDDHPTQSKSSTYKSKKGLPWALDIPVEWAYPHEFMDVGHVYPHIVPWVQSGGTAHRNWYELIPANVSKTFRNGR